MTEQIINAAFFVILLTGCAVAIKTRFIQFRILPKAFGIFFRESEKITAPDRLSPRQALFLAMSTTIGIGNVVGPAIAVLMGGPGSMVWFLIASIIGSSVVYAENMLAFKNRLCSKGKMIVGPMAHLVRIHPLIAIAYSISTAILLILWNATQVRVLGDICEKYAGIPHFIFGMCMSVSVLLILLQGVKLIREIADRMVPFMLAIYLSSLLVILAKHTDQIFPTFYVMFSSFFSTKAVVNGLGSFSLIQAARWGISRSISAIEAGVGTSSIPHSLSTGTDATMQSILSVLGAYVNTLIGFLSGFCILLTNSYQMVDKSASPIELLQITFKKSFPIYGEIALVLSLFLFAAGTILGNAFNGMACFEYLTKKGNYIYLILVSIGIVIGQIFSLATLFECADPFLVCTTGLQMFGIIWNLTKTNLIKKDDTLTG